MIRKRFPVLCFVLVLTGLACIDRVAGAGETVTPVQLVSSPYDNDNNGIRCTYGFWQGLYGRMANIGSGPSFRVYGYPPFRCCADRYCGPCNGARGRIRSETRSSGFLGWRKSHCETCEEEIRASQFTSSQPIDVR